MIIIRNNSRSFLGGGLSGCSKTMSSNKKVLNYLDKKKRLEFHSSGDIV